jgi:Uma2 family endonuclease
VSVGDPGVKLGHDPDELRGPDVAMARIEREPQGSGAGGWLEGAPDLAVEVAGDSQAMSELTNKALEYLAAGAQMVWIIDAAPRRVVVFTAPDHVRVLGSHDNLEGSTLQWHDALELEMVATRSSYKTFLLYSLQKGKAVRRG